MKLFIVTTSFSGGGAEKVAVNLANYYSEKGIKVVLVAFNSSGPYRRQISDSVKVVDLKGSRARYVFFKLRRVILTERPTHILSVIRGSNILVGLAMPRKINCVVAFREASTMHGVDKGVFLKRTIYKLFMRISYRKSSLVIANSDDTKEDLINNRIVNKEKVVVIRNPVIPLDVDLKANEFVENPWFLNDYEVILNVGRLCSQKGQRILVKAFSRVLEQRPKAKLMILGEGEERRSLLEEIASLGVQNSVQIIPFQSNPFPYYKNCDVFVLSSEWEGFGNVLVEALSCGAPVISTDCPGGPRSILDNGKYGTLVSNGDVDALEKAICEQLRNPARWNKKVLERRGKEYAVNKVADDYLWQIDKSYKI